MSKTNLLISAAAAAFLLIWVCAVVGGASITWLQGLPEGYLRLIANWGWVGAVICAVPAVLGILKDKKRNSA